MLPTRMYIGTMSTELDELLISAIRAAKEPNAALSVIVDFAVDFIGADNDYVLDFAKRVGFDVTKDERSSGHEYMVRHPNRAEKAGAESEDSVLPITGYGSTPLLALIDYVRKDPTSEEVFT